MCYARILHCLKSIIWSILSVIVALHVHYYTFRLACFVRNVQNRTSKVEKVEFRSLEHARKPAVRWASLATTRVTTVHLENCALKKNTPNDHWDLCSNWLNVAPTEKTTHWQWSAGPWLAIRWKWAAHHFT